jgi:hypothetical protein
MITTYKNIDSDKTKEYKIVNNLYKDNRQISFYKIL